MFYDQPANSQPVNFARLGAVLLTVILLPPFVALAIVPMLFMLVPVAFVVIPFMIPAFFGAAHSNQVESHRIRAWRGALAPQV